MQPDLNRSCTIRLLVADNSPFHAQLLVSALKRDPDFQIVSSTLCAANLRAALCDQTIDVFVLSAFLDEDAQRGVRILQELREINPHVRAVLILNAPSADSILDAFRAGAKGVFQIQEPSDVLCRCIRRVHEGEAWVSPEQITLLVESLASTPKLRAVDSKGMNLLSKREAEVVRYLAEGLTNREIAERMALSQHTIKNYVFRIFDKLGVSNRIELLFMTLSQTSTAQPLLECLLKDPAEGYEETTFTACRKAAEKGVVTAQVALARMFWMGHQSDRDVMQAYMWFSIAMEQLARTTNHVKKRMTSAQLAEAELGIRGWIDDRSQGKDSSAPTRSSSSPQTSAEMAG